MKKNDIVFGVVIVIVAAIIFIFHSLMGNKDVGSVTVTVDGEVKGTYSLLEEQDIEINGGTNILRIRDGKADMIDADCPDKLCVDQKAVSKNHENIICLPNKVIVEVKSSEESEFDAVTN